MIGYGRQSIDESDIQAVVDVLRGDFLTQGPAVERFERALCELTGARHAVAVNSGTAALHVAYAALRMPERSRLWTSPITFVATVNMARALGWQIDYVDVEPETGNLSVSALAERLALAREDGTLPDVVVPVHLSGRPCDLETMADLAQEYGFRIVEDACHALGAQYLGEPVGSGRFSSAAVFSFHPLKSITTGEGGALLTNDEDIARHARDMRHHGILRESERLVRQDEPSFYHEQQLAGFNYRLSDLHAALGENQLRRLDVFMAKRRERVARYREAFLGQLRSIELPPPCENSAWHLFVVRTRNKQIRDALYQHLLQSGIRTAVHYLPVYQHPWQRLQGPEVSCPSADHYAETALSLPLYPDLTDPQQQRVIEQVRVFDAQIASI